MPISADTCRCQAAARDQHQHAGAIADAATVTAFSQYSTRLDGGHHCRRRNTKRWNAFPTTTPMP